MQREKRGIGRLEMLRQVLVDVDFGYVVTSMTEGGSDVVTGTQ